MRIGITVVVTALAVVLGAEPRGALAQSVTPGELDQAARRGEQLLREQQLLDQERARQRDRERQKPAGEGLQPEEAAAPAVPRDETCINVTSLQLLGARLLPQEAIGDLERSVVGHCVGMSGVNQLLRRVTDAYVSRGYITSRAYVPPQDASAGALTIVVIEGTVERIEIEPPASAAAFTAFPNVVGKVFNLRAAEQGIDQLNRLASNQAKLDIRPGSTPGSSVLRVLNQPRRRASALLATDNTGSPETGEWQSTLTLMADNPLGLNDSLLLSHNRSVDDPSGPAASRATSLNFSVPYGWWMANLSLSDARYASVVKGITRDFVTEGDSRTATLRMERVAYRDQRHKLTLYGGLTRRDGENFVAGQLIDSSSRVVTLAQFDANLSIARGGALWSLDAGLAHGLSWFGADNDPVTLARGAPRSQFTKLTFGAGLTQAFEPLGVRTQLTSTLSAQWSDDVLFASEQMAISGLFAVRGYRDVRLFGDRGTIWRNEIAFPVSFETRRRQLALRPFIGLDAGRLWPHDDVRGAYVSGWTGGFSVGLSPLTLQLSWSGAGPRSDDLPADHLFFARLGANF